MCALMITEAYEPRELGQFMVMLSHFRGAVLPDEVARDVELFVSDLGFDRVDADAAARLVANEKGWAGGDGR